MNIQDFNIKWKSKFRPDLKFPMHIKRKIYNIYKNEVFKDIDSVVLDLIFEELSKEENYFKNMITTKELLKNYEESEKEWFLPISKNWVCGPQLRDIAIITNIQ